MVHSLSFDVLIIIRCLCFVYFFYLKNDKIRKIIYFSILFNILAHFSKFWPAVYLGLGQPKAGLNKSGSKWAELTHFLALVGGWGWLG